MDQLATIPGIGRVLAEGIIGQVNEGSRRKEERTTTWEEEGGSGALDYEKDGEEAEEGDAEGPTRARELGLQMSLASFSEDGGDDDG